jgi:hypothetical protein
MISKVCASTAVRSCHQPRRCNKKSLWIRTMVDIKTSHDSEEDVLRLYSQIAERESIRFEERQDISISKSSNTPPLPNTHSISRFHHVSASATPCHVLTSLSFFATLYRALLLKGASMHDLHSEPARPIQTCQMMCPFSTSEFINETESTPSTNTKRRRD